MISFIPASPDFLRHILISPRRASRSLFAWLRPEGLAAPSDPAGLVRPPRRARKPAGVSGRATPSHGAQEGLEHEAPAGADGPQAGLSRSARAPASVGARAQGRGRRLAGLGQARGSAGFLQAGRGRGGRAGARGVGAPAGVSGAPVGVESAALLCRSGAPAPDGPKACGSMAGPYPVARRDRKRCFARVEAALVMQVWYVRRESPEALRGKSGRYPVSRRAGRS
jgi:hypothetical protein